jgi:methionyl-tRNA formyltransferase
MGAVILTGRGMEHQYVTTKIVQALGDLIDAIIVNDPPQLSIPEKISRARRRYTIPEIGSRVTARAYRKVVRADQHRDENLRRILFPNGDDGEIPWRDLVRTVPSHNGAPCLDLLDGLRPDLIAVYGTVVLKPPVIERAGAAIFNMHTGISPRYRGSDTTFWPLHNGEPEWVGVTIHRLNEGIDTGPILRIGRPEIEPGDDDASLFAKCVALGAALYIDVLRDALEGRFDGEPQSLEAGTSYRSVERTVCAELRTKRLLRNGLLERSKP